MAVEARATAKYIRTSAQKAGLVLNLIRGRDVNSALATLRFARKGVARDIEKELEKFIREPVVTVIVTNFVGPYSEQIRIIGEAAEPKILPYTQNMTLLDVMIAVGGMTEFADGNGASILRTAEGNKQYSVRIRDLVERGDVSANVEMRPGDVLIIPQSWF